MSDINSSLPNVNLPEGSEWTVIGPSTERGKVQCRCRCGIEMAVNVKNLRSGLSKRCKKCSNKKHETHGMSRTQTYRCWKSMIQRCTNPKELRYPDYGGRGIKVCDRWLESFENFLEDMGECPPDKYSLDRIKNDGNYEPGNVRWADRSEQQRNKRNTHFIEFQGKTQTAVMWAEEFGMPLSTFSSRMDRGWSMERIRDQPIGVPRGIQAPTSDKRVIEFDGRFQTTTEWAEEFGLKLSVLLDKLYHGWSMEQIKNKSRRAEQED